VPDAEETTEIKHEKSEPEPVAEPRTVPQSLTRPQLEALRNKLQTKFH